MHDIDPRTLPPDRALGLLITRMDSVRHEAGQHAGLGPADLRLLWLLEDGRARTLREIAETLRLEQSTVNRQVNAAVREGLVERSRPAGSTAHVFRPTGHGRTVFDTEVEYFLALYREALDELGDRRWEFLDQLSTFVEAYGRAVHRR